MLNKIKNIFSKKSKKNKENKDKLIKTLLNNSNAIHK